MSMFLPWLWCCFYSLTLQSPLCTCKSTGRNADNFRSQARGSQVQGSVYSAFPVLKHLSAPLGQPALQVRTPRTLLLSCVSLPLCACHSPSRCWGVFMWDPVTRRPKGCEFVGRIEASGRCISNMATDASAQVCGG